MKEFMVDLATEAGRLALKMQPDIKIGSKGEKNTLTEADGEVEKLIVKRIKEKFPEHFIVGEEGEYAFDASDVWYIDPIDGTTNYAHKDPHFAVSIAYAKDGITKNACIYLPAFDEIYYAEIGKGTYLDGNKITVTGTKELAASMLQGEISPLHARMDDSIRIFRHFMIKADRIRDMGFCAGQLAYVAAGRADGLVKNGQHPWDIAAGMLLVKEAGGKVTDKDGKDIILSNKDKRFNVVASNSKIHDQILDEIKSIRDIDYTKDWW